MAKILHAGEWYEQLSTESLYEEEYERLLMQHSAELFPNYLLIPFKFRVSSEERVAMPDFALLHREYKHWWVVEAELSHHPYEGHVRPQIETLSKARYGDDCADFLFGQDARLDKERLHAMVRGEQPKVLVVVNAAMPSWTHDLKRYDALVTVLEVFRSRHNRHLYRLNGEQPVDDMDTLSYCVADQHLPRVVRLMSPGVLTQKNGEVITLRFRDGLTEWQRLDLQDRVYLTCSKPVSLNRKARYRLVDKGGTYLVLDESF